jgi:transposase
MKLPPLKQIDVTIEGLLKVKERIDRIPELGPDALILKASVDTLIVLRHVYEGKITSIKRLLRMLFGASTEKTNNVLKENSEPIDSGTNSSADESTESSETTGEKVKKKQKGHGRNGAYKFPGAKRIAIPHEKLQHGDRCPYCEKGNVYKKKFPGTIIHFEARPPIEATIYEPEKLRCNTCGKTFQAEVPQEALEKYDPTAASMIGLLKYGCGFPFNRLEKLQEQVGIPLPASTQFDIEEKAGNRIYYGFEELKKQAAQTDIVYNDDTTMKILELMRENQQRDTNDSSRTGMFTTGVVAEKDDRKIAIFFTGRNHAGENLADVLKNREQHRGPPIQMCDAASRNLPKDILTILSNSNSHARRKFVDIAWCFRDECTFVLETYQKVYANDKLTKEKQMSPDARLQFHQNMSKPVMDELETWLHEQLDQKKVEPNSSLGEAIKYIIKHWDALTQFLKVPGAPLDSNVVERALKMAINNRKNAYFYKTEHGAYIGDMFMSLILTCNLNGANPFDYLTQLQKHSEELRKNPADWMPWNYQEALQNLST